jgi:hypothetical protein
VTRLEILKKRLLLHCSFSALFSLERARLIEQLMRQRTQRDTRAIITSKEKAQG